MILSGTGPISRKVAEAIVSLGGRVKASVQGHEAVVTAAIWSPGTVASTETMQRDHYLTAELLDEFNRYKFSDVCSVNDELQAALDAMDWQRTA